MKKTIIRTMSVAFAAVAMTACNNQAPKVEEKTHASADAVGTKIAYVEVDSIMSQYKFCKEYSLILQKKSQNVQAGLQKQDADLRALQQRLGNEFQAETEKFNTALRDSIQHYLAAYNKDKKYALILSKAGDNILYADKAYDITNEVIAGLNKAYKPAPVKKETK